MTPIQHIDRLRESVLAARSHDNKSRAFFEGTLDGIAYQLVLLRCDLAKPEREWLAPEADPPAEKPIAMIDGSKLDFTPRPMYVPPGLILGKPDPRLTVKPRSMYGDDPAPVAPSPWPVAYFLAAVVSMAITLYLAFGRNP